MSVTDTLLRTAVDKARPVLDRFGILAAPARDMFDARRAITIERPPAEVAGFLADPAHTAELFVLADAVSIAASTPTTVAWTLGERGRAEATLRPGPEDSTEVVLEVHLAETEGGRPRYADNAGVITIRALHRAKSLIQTGEAPSLAVNPAGRTVPDPYGD